MPDHCCKALIPADLLALNVLHLARSATRERPSRHPAQISLLDARRTASMRPGNECSNASVRREIIFVTTARRVSVRPAESRGPDMRSAPSKNLAVVRTYACGLSERRLHSGPDGRSLPRPDSRIWVGEPRRNCAALPIRGAEGVFR